MSNEEDLLVEDEDAELSPVEKAHKRKQLQALNKRYQQRITIAKKGQESIKSGDYIEGIKNYNIYFTIISDVKGVDMEDLNPDLFKGNNETHEILLISHIYWDLVKIYDYTPHLKPEFTKALNKFVLFTANQPFQYVNSEMLRKHILKDNCVNKTLFKEAHNKIQVSSKKCYIATYAYGENHPVTQKLRSFRDDISKFALGKSFIYHYYANSPKLVEFFNNNPRLGRYSTLYFLRPLISFFSKIIEFLIIRK